MRYLIGLVAILMVGSMTAQARPRVDASVGSNSAYSATFPCSQQVDASDFVSSATAWDPQDLRTWEVQFNVTMDADYSCGEGGSPTLPTAYIIFGILNNNSPTARTGYSNVTGLNIYLDDVQYFLVADMTYTGTGVAGHQFFYNYAPTTVPTAGTTYRVQCFVVGANTEMSTLAHNISWN